MRQLAAEVGVQAAALYRYFPTKEDLLFTLMREHMQGLSQAWEAAKPADADPAQRLSAYVENHIAFHIEVAMPRMCRTWNCAASRPKG